VLHVSHGIEENYVVSETSRSLSEGLTIVGFDGAGGERVAESAGDGG
jgi:hypothetical protein